MNEQFDLKLALTRAKHGDVASQRDLGWRYQTGDGVQKDLEQALYWYKLAASKNDSIALTALGLIYSDTSDRKQAIELLLRAAKHAETKDCVVINFHLGRILISGNPSQEDYNLALDHLKYSAGRGHITSQFLMGSMFQYGYGVNPDWRQAFVWFKRAAADRPKNVADIFPDNEAAGLAMVRLAYMHENPRYDEAGRLLVQPDEEKAMALYFRAAEIGCGEAAAELACRFLSGNGVPKDKSEAEKWLLRAAELGNTQAIELWNEWAEHGTPEVRSLQERLRSKELSLEGVLGPTVRGTKNMADILSPIQKLVGLNKCKNEIIQLVKWVEFNRVRERLGMSGASFNMALHLVFTGNPGTGKTTVARYIGEIYKSFGLLKKGHLIEVSRKDLVGRYIGETAPLTEAVIQSALDGVLFIDEAYSLHVSDTSNDFGGEAVSTLLAGMENYRDRLVVIVAGYTDEMAIFIESNPGLKSRFSSFIDFEDYSAEELAQIFDDLAQAAGYKLNNQTRIALENHLRKVRQQADRSFGNARYVRTAFEKTTKRLASRVMSKSRINKKLDYIMIEMVDLWFQSENA